MTQPPRPPISIVAPIRWSREPGYLEIWDAEARTWHQVWARTAPQSWRDILYAARRELYRDAEGS